MDCSTRGSPVLHYLPEFAPIHVHWAGDTIQPSHPPPPPSPVAFNLFRHQGLFQWVSSLHQVAKLLKLQLQHHSFHEYGIYQWIFKTNFLQNWLFDHLSPGDFQESSPTSQFKSISSLALSLLYGPTLTSVHDYWEKKNIALTIWTFVGKVMSLLFNMLPRFVIAFLPRNIFWFHVCSYCPQWFWSLRKENLSLLPLFSFCLMKWWDWIPWS